MKKKTTNNKNTKMIRTSIIGPELKSKSCTFEWFMNSKSKIYGWNKNYWNGITTLEWSKMCYDMMLNWNSYKVLNTPFIKCISKYELLKGRLFELHTCKLFLISIFELSIAYLEISIPDITAPGNIWLSSYSR